MDRPLIHIPVGKWLPEFRFTLLQIVTHIGSWAPLAVLVYRGFTNNLTVNPIQYLTYYTGDTAIRLLILSLACTPAHSIFGFKEPLKLRRPLGLYAFIYAALHFSIFLFDYNADPKLLYEAIFEKRYALVGFAAFLLLLPMALTSTKGWQRRLGKNWKRLHQFVYLAGLLVVIHYVWLVKSDIRTPLAYGAIVVALLIARIPVVRRAFASVRGWAAGKVRAARPGPRTIPDRISTRKDLR
jgi:sulfoxide reductase heme-binding subunit YedZ